MASTLSACPQGCVLILAPLQGISPRALSFSNTGHFPGGSIFPKHQLLTLNKALPPVKALQGLVQSLMVTDTEGLSGSGGRICQGPSIAMVISRSLMGSGPF